MQIATDGTLCGYKQKGKCSNGICEIAEEDTLEYKLKKEKKFKSFQKIINGLLKDNEYHATKKAVRWFKPENKKHLDSKPAVFPLLNSQTSETSFLKSSSTTNKLSLILTIFVIVFILF